MLIFAWVYELTPEALKEDSQVTPEPSSTAHTAKKLDIAVIALLVVAMGFFAYVQLVRKEPTALTTAETASRPEQPAPSPIQPMGEADPPPARRLSRPEPSDDIMLSIDVGD